MHQAVANRCFVNTPRLRVVDGECLIAAVTVGMIGERIAEFKHVVHEPKRKFLDIRLVPLAMPKFLPRPEQVLDTDNLFEGMVQLNAHRDHSSKPPPSGTAPQLLPLLEKLKDAYLLWFQYYQILPKAHRYTLGRRIDSLFIETIEAVATAAFLSRAEKLPFVRVVIRKVDTVKILFMVLWETKSIDAKQYARLSEPLQEIGKMLGGWQGQLQKQNSPNPKAGEK